MNNIETKQQRYRKTEKYTVSRLKSQERQKERYANDPQYHDHVRKLSRLSYQRHARGYIERAKKWAKSNPEKRYQITVKNHSKGSSLFKITARQYKYALHSWSKLIRKRDDNKCQICHRVAEESHHILHKSLYPELSLNLNNGISLCLEHHYEIHGKVFAS